MTNKFVFKLLSLILVIVVITSGLFACFDDSDISGITTVDGGLGTSSTTKNPNIIRPANTTTSTTTTTTNGGAGTTNGGAGTTNGDTTSSGGSSTPADDHLDIDNNGFCDECGIDVVETIDFYNFNDLHGKFEHVYSTDAAYGVQKLTTYIENQREIDDNLVLLSSGDMWQGGSASNETKGTIITDWMNYLKFDAMTLGNHEFDWGQDAIKTNVALAEFPILAINIYDNATGQRVDYCQPSVMVDCGGAKVGIIGAIGDCYSSISSDKTQGINFKVGSQLTALVKAESTRLREAGADIIIYLIHDGATNENSPNVTDYYDLTLSSGGYVDVVFGGHTHKNYIDTFDMYGIPHIQGGGDNQTGMTHIEVDVNFANGQITLNAQNYIAHSQCSNLKDAEIIEDLLDDYNEEIGWIYKDLGYNASYRNSSTISSTVAKLYYEAGVEKWGDEYNIVLAGGSINTRYPYKVLKGQVQYADLLMVVPFDNPLYLCKIKGSDLKSKFLNNSSYTKYSTITASQVQDSQYYYIVADSWTALYAWAKCTPIELYDNTTYARDLLAEYIKSGGWSK